MAKIVYVRSGAMHKTDRFSPPEEGVQVGSDVIVRTQRGVEWGQVVYVTESQDGEPKLVGEVLRKATPADREKLRDIVERRQAEQLQFCREAIKAHNLPMKLVQTEHLFGGNKIIFYFLADGRVDFRALVKDLAKEYRTRIEMRQIGVRDEARLLGQVGPCGQELCCRTFLNVLKPVPMKLAKDQKSTLDPAKISGACGRLKCCLKYEESLYRELKQALPRRGTKVATPKGDGLVVDYDIIAQTVQVELKDRSRETFPVADIKTLEDQ